MTLSGTTRLVPWLARMALVITCAAAMIATQVWDALAGYKPSGGSYRDLSHDGGVPFVTDAWGDTGGDTSKMISQCG